MTIEEAIKELEPMFEQARYQSREAFDTIKAFVADQTRQDAARLLSVKILLERSELRSDIRKDSVRAKNYETARNNVAAWIEEVQP